MNRAYARDRTLGMKWNRDKDTFSFTVKLKGKKEFSRRSLRSEVAGIFDPMGLASPVIVTAKML